MTLRQTPCTIDSVPDDVESLLRQLYQNLEQVELEPTDVRYVPFEDHLESFGPDVIAELGRDIAWSTPGSTYFLSGLRGSGKSTQLLRLQANLQSQGFAVVRLNAEDYLNIRLPINVTEFLFFLVGGIADQVETSGWLPDAGSRIWSRLRDWVQALPRRIEMQPEAKLSTGADLGFLQGEVALKASLRADESFVAQLRRFLEGRLSALVAEANEVVDELVDELRSAWPDKAGSNWKGLVVLVDSLDHIRGDDFDKVRRALVDVVDHQASSIQLHSTRTAYIVPPWLRVEGAPNRSLSNIKVRDRDKQRFQPGYETMRTILQLRCPPDTTTTDFLTEDVLDGLIHDSGGHLRDFFRLIRSATVAATADTLPLPDAAIARGRQELREGFIPLADDEISYLGRVATTHQVHLAEQHEWETLANLLDRHLVLGFQNGELWYDVHPIIADLVTESQPSST
ncbi:hypothetical protein BN381_680008 [Candidatus Microthrix parvicella RN1]|uniref:AAA+ ATPase domain-containing protein n=1 Tax=Candidatus Neomicrothrix parvicella RN1 TaxID=1229780 RepID=R4Z328_9ACTN|nr:hypothetical protein BN381_680008 [Candidatus Microthrix parvicella RN1]